MLLQVLYTITLNHTAKCNRSLKCPAHLLEIGGVDQVDTSIMSYPRQHVAGGREVDTVNPATVRVKLCKKRAKLTQPGQISCKNTIR